MQAREPPSDVDETTLEVGGWYVIQQDPDTAILWWSDGANKVDETLVAGNWPFSKERIKEKRNPSTSRLERVEKKGEGTCPQRRKKRFAV